MVVIVSNAVLNKANFLLLHKSIDIKTLSKKFLGSGWFC